VPFLHTAPDGKPADEVGIFVIDRLFTNVVHTQFAIIFDPTIIVQLLLFVLLPVPPRTAE